MDDETIRYNPLPEDPTPVGPRRDRPRKPRKERAKSEEIIPMSRQENFVAIALEEIEKTKQEEQEKTDSAIDVFTHSKTGFPGAWSEEEVVELLNAWEQAMDALRASETPFNVTSMVMETLKKNGFREVRKFDVWNQMQKLRTEYNELGLNGFRKVGKCIWNQMQKLRTEYKTYRGLQALGIETVKAECLPQMMRIFRKRSNRRYRRRRASTASNMTGVSEDSIGQMDIQLKQDANDQVPPRSNRRVSFQRQSFQRSLRVMIGQQKAILEYLQTVSKAIDESNGKVVGLLEQLVALQRN